jgi:hypothetical protein
LPFSSNKEILSFAPPVPERVCGFVVRIEGWFITGMVGAENEAPEDKVTIAGVEKADCLSPLTSIAFMTCGPAESDDDGVANQLPSVPTMMVPGLVEIGVFPSYTTILSPLMPVPVISG